uniref:Uncharacterized protein n=1 Tax=Trypanosoma congolense (strain IL3000) TaxID=1068625 RepID=G0ULF8_TRYCI|nr:conserved hypothetical protein [Trypanosoma congolense IL3000]
MKPVAVGTLPVELIDTIRRGQMKIQRLDNGSLVFSGEANCPRWYCELAALDRSQEMSTSYRHQGTGEVGEVRVLRIATVTLSAEEHVVAGPVDPEARESAITATAPQPSLSASPQSASDTAAQHSSLAARIAHYLAPAPRQINEILHALSLEDSEVVRSVLHHLTTTNRRGQLELSVVGYEMVDIDSFDSRAVKQQVANNALQKISGNKELLDRFSLYADRDALLAACSKGIMAGLGSAKRKRSDDDTDEDDDVAESNAVRAGATDSETKGISEGSIGHAVQDAVMFTSMDQSDIRWNDADIAKDSWVMPEPVAEVLEQLQSAASIAKTSSRTALPPMPITSATQLSVALEQYTLLRREYKIIYSRLKRLEEVSDEAQGWCQSQGARFTKELNVELQNWFERQEGPRSKLTAAMDVIYQALYRLKRDIEDYVSLREWGVLS